VFISLTCTVNDDGDFILPDEYSELFSTYDISTSNLSLVRMAISTAVNGDAAVMTANGALYLF